MGGWIAGDRGAATDERRVASAVDDVSPRLQLPSWRVYTDCTQHTAVVSIYKQQAVRTAGSIYTRGTVGFSTLFDECIG